MRLAGRKLDSMNAEHVVQQIVKANRRAERLQRLEALKNGRVSRSGPFKTKNRDKYAARGRTYKGER